MRKLYVVLGLLVNFQTAAMAIEKEMDQKKQENFLAMKQEALKQMDEKINILRQARECINAANDWAAMKKCHEDQEAAMKKMQQENRQLEIKRIEEQQQKLEEKKRQLQQEKESPKENKQ